MQNENKTILGNIKKYVKKQCSHKNRRMALRNLCSNAALNLRINGEMQIAIATRKSPTGVLNNLKMALTQPLHQYFRKVNTRNE